MATNSIIDQNTNADNNHRSSNYELLRIIMMILIVASHYVHNSGVLENIMGGGTSTFKSLTILVFGMWGKPIINGFVLITGYFMCEREIKIQKAIKMAVEVLFYNIVIYCIFVATGYTKVSLYGIVTNFLPLKSFSTNFAPCFIIFYLFIPFINILIRHLDKNKHRFLVILMGTFYVILGTIPKLKISFNYITWFTFIYILISYFRFYREDMLQKQKLWIVVFLFTYVASVVTIYAGMSISFKIGNNYVFYFLEDSNKIFAVVLAFSLFCIFHNIKVPYSKWINNIARATFGVLLIHANSDLMRAWLWKDTLKVTTYFQTDLFFIHAVLSVILVYLACTIIELLRMHLSDKYFEKVSMSICRVLPTYF